jgi:transcriptional regulator with XRE-family HTH domain
MAVLDIQIGRLARERRQALGLSVDDVAARLGMTAGLYETFESGGVRARPAQLCGLAELLGVGVAYFFRDLTRPSVPAAGLRSEVKHTAPLHLDRQIGERVYTFRTSRGMSVAILSKHTELNEDTIMRIEDATEPVTAAGLWRIARAMELPIEVFFGAVTGD